jgi:hypothetical protein
MERFTRVIGRLWTLSEAGGLANAVQLGHESSVTFSLSDPVDALGNIENLTVTGSAAISGTCNVLDNIIIGNSGNNTLAGLGGADEPVRGLGCVVADLF